VVERVAILGFGDIVAGPKVAAALAGFHSERPIEIRCWDEDREKCELVCRVLRMFLKASQLPHRVFALEYESVIQDADAVILVSRDAITDFEPRYVVEPEETSDGHDVHKYQALRWINREDWPSEFIEGHAESPILKWLNGLE
jgi:hypothetical protein